MVAVDTFFAGTLKGVSKIYRQTAIDCHSRYARATRCPRKLPVTAAHLMNNDVLPIVGLIKPRSTRLSPTTAARSAAAPTSRLTPRAYHGTVTRLPLCTTP